MTKHLLTLILPLLFSSTMAEGLTTKTEKVKVDGWLGQKINQCIQHRIIGEDVDKLTAPFFQ